MFGLTELIIFLSVHKKMILTALVLFVYLLYYLKFSFYNYLQKWVPGDGKKKHGIALPSYPNGWYRLCNSRDLKKGQSKFFKHNGRHVVCFRAYDGNVYCLDAYCPHMGANLGHHGKVKHNDCIQCPFHGWLFDGKTGKLVQDKQKQPKKIVQYEYNNGIEAPTSTKNGEFLVKCHEGEYTQKTYKVLEWNHIILVWFHSQNDDKPQWYPLKITENVEHRGTVTFFVNSHLQEIAENLVDQAHFKYIHKLFFNTISFINYTYTMKNMYGDNPNLLKFMEHKNGRINTKIQYFLKKYLNNENKKFTNVVSLDISISIFGSRQFFVYNLLMLQMGVSQAFVFMNTTWFPQQIMQFNITPIEKYMNKVVVQCYTHYSWPYFYSAFILKELHNQSNEDATVVLNQKVFGEKVTYAQNNLNDDRFKQWRNWTGQFYEGAAEFEKKMEKFEW